MVDDPLHWYNISKFSTSLSATSLFSDRKFWVRDQKVLMYFSGGIIFDQLTSE